MSSSGGGGGVGVPSAEAVASWTIPSASTSALNPTLQKFTVILIAFVLLAWIMHWSIVARRVAQLWTAIKRQNVVRVESVAEGAQLSRDDLLSILRSRSSLHIAPVESVRIRGHVHTKMCRVRPAAAVMTPAASSSGASPSPPPATDAASSCCSVVLRVSGTTALRVDVYAGVSVRLVQQLYAQHDKFLARPVAAAACTGAQGSKARRGTSSSPAAPQAASGLAQIELAVLESPRTGAAAGLGDTEAEEAHARFLRSYVLDTLAQQRGGQQHWDAPNGAAASALLRSTAAGPLLWPGEYAWKSSSLIVEPPPAPAPAPVCNCGVSPVTPMLAPAVGSGLAAPDADGVAPFQKEIVVPVPQALLTTLCRDAAVAAGWLHPSPSPAPAPAAAGRGNSNGAKAASPAPDPVYPLLVHISPLPLETASLLAVARAGAMGGAPRSASPFVCPSPSCPLATPGSQAIAPTPAATPASDSSSSSPRAMAIQQLQLQQRPSSSRSGRANQQFVSELTVVELALSSSASPSASPAPSSDESDIAHSPPPAASPTLGAASSDAVLLSKLRFEKQFVLVSTFPSSSSFSPSSSPDAGGVFSPSPPPPRKGSAAAAAAAAAAGASPSRPPERLGSPSSPDQLRRKNSRAREKSGGATAVRHAVYELEELYDLHTAVRLPPLPSSSVASPGPSGASSAPSSSASASAPASTPGPGAAEEADDADHDCVVCMSAVKDIVLLPCRHVCLCHSCHESVNKCPVCRCPIQAHMQFVEPAAQSKLLRRRSGQEASRKHSHA